MENITENNLSHINQFLTIELIDIYKAITFEDNNLTKNNEEFGDLLSSIEYCINRYNKDLMLSPTSDIMRLGSIKNVINELFVMFIRNSYNICNKISSLFIFFCDYFDFNYHTIYELLHDKIKLRIKNEYKNIIGNDNYNKLCKKHNTQQIRTLFDL